MQPLNMMAIIAGTVSGGVLLLIVVAVLAVVVCVGIVIKRSRYMMCDHSILICIGTMIFVAVGQSLIQMVAELS